MAPTSTEEQATLQRERERERERQTDRTYPILSLRSPFTGAFTTAHASKRQTNFGGKIAGFLCRSGGENGRELVMVRTKASNAAPAATRKGEKVICKWSSV